MRLPKPSAFAMTTVATPPWNSPMEPDTWSRVLAVRTAAVDALVGTLAGSLSAATASPMAIVAVGGYGRRELFPYSDVDLLLLYETEESAGAAREALAAFLQGMWDAGVRVSHSVRTPEECGQIHERNPELDISLLDHRYLAGDRALYAGMATRAGRLVRSERSALVRQIARLTRARHGKFDHTYLHLEPNLKETPGGLRDLQVARWLERLRGGGEEADELREARAFLSEVRCWLHDRAGRDDNVLRFENQEDAAVRWEPAGPAAWMRRYYRHARTIDRAARRELEEAEAKGGGLVSEFHAWRARLSNAEFSVSRERVYLRAPQNLDGDAVLRLFAFVARHGIRPAPDTARRVAEGLPHLWVAGPPPRWPALQEILALSYAALALREMHETGALAAAFPELAAIDCLVVRDFYHRYTVDEHSLAAIASLGELRGSGGHADAWKRPFAELAGELDRPGLAAFALLFHDVGKGTAAGRHVEGSLAAAESAMARIQMPPGDRETVRFLIRHHLALPALTRSRDLGDPATGREAAALAGTVEALKALTLVSWADVSAVHPGAMTPWRAGELWRLYTAAYQELTRELDAARIEGPPGRVVPFLAGFPTRYLRTHGPAELEAHLLLAEAAAPRGVAAAVEPVEGAWRLTLVARDAPNLFASVAGTLASFGMNILKAEAFGNHAGQVLDTFTFADPLRTLELNPTEADRLRATVERVVLGKVDVRQLLQRRPKAAPPSRQAAIRPAVAFDNEASPRATLIQIVAQDRPGLLYDVAAAISAAECNIEVVLVDTEAHKAIDVFYVTAAGGKLDEGRRTKLAAALGQACAGPAAPAV